MHRVLVVDDDNDFLWIVGEYLESTGIQFHLADSAAQARKRLAHFHYDLVISDLHMPGESGLDLFRSVSLGYPGLPFILMSGNLDPRVRREALRMGICNFVEKPFQLTDLKRLVTSRDMCAMPAGIRVPAA
jgi:two-component system phosphate regulon response regulator OmpR